MARKCPLKPSGGRHNLPRRTGLQLCLIGPVFWITVRCRGLGGFEIKEYTGMFAQAREEAGV